MFIESCTKYGSIEAIEKCQIQKLMIAHKCCPIIVSMKLYIIQTRDFYGKISLKWKYHGKVVSKPQYVLGKMTKAYNPDSNTHK